jgi:hypothetical protein
MTATMTDATTATASNRALTTRALLRLEARRRQRVADPVALARRAGIDPDPWQVTLLRSTERQLILCCARQSGKSLVAALLAAHQALTVPASLTLLLAPSWRQSSELFRRVKTLVVGPGAMQPVQESALSLELANGARVVSLPGTEATVRGFANVALLVVDEAARTRDDLYQAIRPMIAVSGGRIVLLSTPWGKRGHFWTAWEHEGAAWHRARVTAAECPRIDPAWLEQERERIGSWWFEQEYNCVFTEAENSVFNHAYVMAALKPDIKPLLPEGAGV